MRESEKTIASANESRKSAVAGIFDKVETKDLTPEAREEVATEPEKAKEGVLPADKPPSGEAVPEKVVPDPEPPANAPDQPITDTKPPEPVVPTSEEEDIDFDKKPVATEKPEEPRELSEREERSVATMRDQLQKQGRKAKELENELIEKELALKSRMEEIEQLRKEMDSPARVANDPMSSPRVKAIVDEIDSDRKAFERTLPQGERKAFADGFNSMLKDYAAAANAPTREEEDKAIDELQDKIGTTVSPDVVRDIMGVLSRNSGKYEQILQYVSGASEQAEEDRMNEVVGSWDKSSLKATAAINTIADVSREFIDANPNSPQSYVANLVATDPAYKDRAEKVKASIVEAFNGKRPLTRAEMAALKENEEMSGVKPDAFLRERAKRQDKARAETMKRAYIATMLAPELPEMLAELAKFRQEAAAKAAEKEAILTATTATTPGEPEKTDLKPSERPSAVGSVLDAMRR